MTHRIQKTIISKYLELVDKPSVTEPDLVDLFDVTKSLYKDGILKNNDLFRQKLEIIGTKLETDIEAIRRKRTLKEVKLDLSSDLYQILRNDLEGIDYSKTNLSDLNKFENSGELTISREHVIKVLENLVVLKRRLNSEGDLEKFIAEQLAYIFGKEKVSRQYSVGGFLALKTDIDVGNGQVGIELKIADHLGATDMQRLIGQVVYYKKRFYDNNLLVFLASRSSITSHITEMKDFVEELGVTVVYVQAVNS